METSNPYSAAGQMLGKKIGVQGETAYEFQISGVHHCRGMAKMVVLWDQMQHGRILQLKLPLPLSVVLFSKLLVFLHEMTGTVYEFYTVKIISML